MLKFENVYKIYETGTHALEGVNFEILPKDFAIVIGASGAGKSTIIRLAVAEDFPNEGRVLVGGQDTSTLRKKEIPHLRRQVGVVFQDYKLLPKKTAYENVAFALEVSGQPTRVIRKIVPQSLKLVGLEEKMREYPDHLSGGEQQRIAIARAMAHRPRLLLADEPTGNLDPKTGWEIIQLLEKINSFGTTVVLTTHNKEIVNRLKKRVITLRKGKVVSDQKVGKYEL